LNVKKLLKETKEEISDFEQKTKSFEKERNRIVEEYTEIHDFFHKNRN